VKSTGGKIKYNKPKQDYTDDYKFKGGKGNFRKKKYYEAAEVVDVPVSYDNYEKPENKKRRQKPRKKQQKEIPSRNKGMLVDYDEVIKMQKEERGENKSESFNEDKYLEPLQEKVMRKEIEFEPEFREELENIPHRYEFEQPRGYKQEFIKSPYDHKAPYNQQRPPHYEDYRPHYDQRERYYDEYRSRPYEQEYRDRRFEQDQRYLNEDYRDRYYDSREMRQYEKIKPSQNKPIEYIIEPNVNNNDMFRDKFINITSQRSNGTKEEEVRDINKTNIDSLRSYFDRLRKYTSQMDSNGKEKSILSTASNTGRNYTLEK
jgi:hypothetical protein